MNKVLNTLKKTTIFTLGSVILVGESAVSLTRKSIDFVKSGESQKVAKDTFNSIKDSAISKYSNLRQPSESACKACDVVLTANIAEYSDICLGCMKSLAEEDTRNAYANEDLRSA